MSNRAPLSIPAPAPLQPNRGPLTHLPPSDTLLMNFMRAGLNSSSGQSRSEQRRGPSGLSEADGCPEGAAVSRRGCCSGTLSGLRARTHAHTSARNALYRVRGFLYRGVKLPRAYQLIGAPRALLATSSTARPGVDPNLGVQRFQVASYVPRGCVAKAPLVQIGECA